MQKKNIFKTVALAMLMPAMLLTTACSSEDDLVNNEPTVKKGYALPVTVNVTRQGDATTRATYTYNENTKKGTLAFSDGDKLFVRGNDNSVGGAGQFAGTLDYVSEGTFSGTIYTESPYEGTAAALFTDATSIHATLLPNGYDTKGFLSIYNNNTPELYDDVISATPATAFVASEIAKATGVEQLSLEQATKYSSGFALTPLCAILNFTISGLAAETQNVKLKMYYGSDDYTVTGSVTPNASGVATFAIGVPVGANIKNMDDNLIVGTHNFTLSSTALTAGKIYNITRGTGATVDLSTINTAYIAQNGETLTGTLASNVKISIADGATVILDNVTINGTNDIEYVWGGINCERDAKIILKGTNTLKGFYYEYPGIYVNDGYTLTIEGTGSLNASSNGSGAGIGGGYGVNCGNIIINGGTITATGGAFAAGIGGGGEGSCCGNITINGGTITATGGDYGAGIGSGGYGSCSEESEEGLEENSGETSCGKITINGGTITAEGGCDAAGIGSGCYGYCSEVIIKNTVTRVTATKGSDDSCAIGYGENGTCVSVIIDDTDGCIAESPYTYEPKPTP